MALPVPAILPPIPIGGLIVMSIVGTSSVSVPKYIESLRESQNRKPEDFRNIVGSGTRQMKAD